MCLAIPLKIKTVHGNTAEAEALGVSREIRVDFIENPQPGDYVLVHAGFAIERLPGEQALEDLELWEELEHAVAAE